MAAELHSDLIRLANEFGADETYSRAGGGNASVKHGGVLHIKPSGVPLATLGDADLVPLRIDVLLKALDSDAPVEGDPVRAAAQAAQIGDTAGRRPSVEILFHASIPDALVLHLHPLVANAITCNVRGRELTKELLGDQAVWVDYIDPGVPLARGVAAARREHEARTGQPAPAITLLGNHGIIVSGASYDDVTARTRWLTATVQAAIDATQAPTAFGESRDVGWIASAFRDAVGGAAVAWSRGDEDIVRTSSGTAAGPVSGGPLTPDQIVYAGSLPLVLEAADSNERIAQRIADFRATHGRPPLVAVIPSVAVIAAGDSDKAAQNALATYLDALRVARDADRIGTVRVMSPSERHFIEHWEAEAYRKSVAASGG
ncbi:MAG: class II aldolase/adducin family protein [Arachnia sp.]